MFATHRAASPEQPTHSCCLSTLSLEPAARKLFTTFKEADPSRQDFKGRCAAYTSTSHHNAFLVVVWVYPQGVQTEGSCYGRSGVVTIAVTSHLTIDQLRRLQHLWKCDDGDHSPLPTVPHSLAPPPPCLTSTAEVALDRGSALGYRHVRDHRRSGPFSPTSILPLQYP